MAGWNGSGVFSKTYSWVQDQLNGILIRADRHDQNDTDFTNGINNCLTKDGQNSAIADLPMGTFKHTGVGKATALNQYATAEQVIDNEFTYYTASGTDTYTLAPNPAVTSYAAGQGFKVNFTNGNTGAATININTLGAKALVKGASTALVSGDLVAGKIYEIVYDGTRFQVKDVAVSLTILTGNLDANGFNIGFDTNTGITDDSGNEQLFFVKTASAVNEFRMTNAATGTGPILSATGGDTDVPINLQVKANAAYNFLGTASTAAEARLFEDTDNGSNYTGIKGAANIGTSHTLTLPAALPASKKAVQVDNAGAVTYDGISSLVVQQVTSVVTASTTGTTAIPYDDSIPLNTEGDEYITVTITPTNASNILEFFGNVFFGEVANSDVPGTMALFQDSTANAIWAGPLGNAGATASPAQGPMASTLYFRMTAGTTSATTFKLRAGLVNTTGLRINGSVASRIYGGVAASYLIVKEMTQ